MAFAKAQVLDNKAKTSAAKAKADERPIEGLHDYALLCSVIKSLEAVRDTTGADVKGAARQVFLKQANDQKKVENFKAREGNATASIQLSRKGSNIPLNDEQCEMLDINEIEYATIEDVVDTYAINPKYRDDEAVLSKAEKALTKAGLPEDFIVKQQPVIRRVVTEDTCKQIVERGLLGSLLDVAYILKVMPKMDPTDERLRGALDAITASLFAPAEEVKEKMAPKKKSSGRKKAD